MAAVTPAPVSARSIDPGRYICVKTSSIFGRVICIATRSEFDHTAIVIPGQKIVEATTNAGVVISPLAKYAGHHAVVCTDPMTAREKASVSQAALSLVGDRYNFSTIEYQALADLTGWHWAALLIAARGGHVFDCSQTAAYCGARAGLDWMCGQAEQCLVSPGMLAARPTVAPVAWV